MEDDSYPLIANGNGFVKHDNKPIDKLARKKLSLCKAAQYCLIFIALDIAKQIVTYALKYYNGGKYPIPQTQIVTWIEAIKLVFSLGSLMFFQNYGHNYKFRFSLLFAIPALIYSLNNNLYLLALNYTTPPVWLMLIQSRVFLTALAYKWFFGKKLTRLQWFGLSLLVSSLCIVTFMNSSVSTSTANVNPIPDALKNVNFKEPSAPSPDSSDNIPPSIVEPQLKPMADEVYKEQQNIPENPHQPFVEEMAHSQPLPQEEAGNSKKGFGSFKKSRSKRDASQFVSPMAPESLNIKSIKNTNIPGISMMAVLLSLLSASLSVTASIITEYFFKNDKRPFMEQQVQMYVFSSLISALFCFLEPNAFGRMFTLDLMPNLQKVHGISPYTILFLLLGTIMLGALGGLAVAAIVKNLDNIVKIYCSSLGNMGTALISWSMFPDRFKLDAYYSGALALLFAAIYMYESPLNRK